MASGGVIFTTIQKFSPEEGNVYETLSERENIVVIADEAHRTQYGFKAKTVDAKDEHGNVIGKKTVYGFAKYMRDALPNATYIRKDGWSLLCTNILLGSMFQITKNFYWPYFPAMVMMAQKIELPIGIDIWKGTTPWK